jgi:serine/threonine-protein phosphatase 2A regulatory subunit A
VELLSQSLLPAIVDLAEDGKWRVRLAIIPVLAKQLGKEYFGEKLSALCLAWLDDSVYSIRRAATENLLSLTELFGEAWAVEHAIPRIERMCEYKNYLRRTTALYALQVIIRSLSAGTIEKFVLPLVLQLSTDPVPNIRFVAARTLQLIALRLANRTCGQASQRASEDISASLAKLLVDSDRDVKFHATEVM